MNETIYINPPYALIYLAMCRENERARRLLAKRSEFHNIVLSTQKLAMELDAKHMRNFSHED